METQTESKSVLQIESDVVKALKTIFDPEIPVNIYELGLIYMIDVDDEKNVRIDMTLTAPNCPVADTIPIEVRDTVKLIDYINDVHVNMVFDPPWDMSRMSEEAKLELGYL